MGDIPITEEGFFKLKEELIFLKKEERPKNIKAIEEARAHGDLSENAEFHAAKERQSFIAGRIAELEFKLANADIIKTESLPKDKAVFGSLVLLENLETGKQVQYQLVGEEEVDLKNKKISIASPIGKAIIGKEPGSEIKFFAPGGEKIYELVDII